MMLYCSSFPSIPTPIIHATKTSQLRNPPLNTSSNNSPPPSLLQGHHFPSKLHHLHQKLQPQTPNAHSTEPASSFNTNLQSQMSTQEAADTRTSTPELTQLFRHLAFCFMQILTPKTQTPSKPTRPLISYTKQLLSYPLQPESNISALHAMVKVSDSADITTQRQCCFILHLNTSNGTGRIAFP
jgi:hypothetical protein